MRRHWKVNCIHNGEVIGFNLFWLRRTAERYMRFQSSIGAIAGLYRVTLERI